MTVIVYERIHASTAFGACRSGALGGWGGGPKTQPVLFHVAVAPSPRPSPRGPFEFNPRLLIFEFTLARPRMLCVILIVSRPPRPLCLRLRTCHRMKSYGSPSGNFLILQEHKYQTHAIPKDATRVHTLTYSMAITRRA